MPNLKNKVKNIKNKVEGKTKEGVGRVTGSQETGGVNKTNLNV